MRGAFVGIFASLFVISGPLQAQIVEGLEADYRQVSTNHPPPRGEGADRKEAAKRVLEDVNRYRRANGLHPLERNEKLEKAAAEFADFLASTHRYGHTADGRRPSERVRLAGYDFCFVAENQAYRYRPEPLEENRLANLVLVGWKNSPKHRANLLAEAPTETAVAIGRSRKTGAYFAVQVFARPAELGSRFRVRNDSEGVVRYRIEVATEEGTLREREYRLGAGSMIVHQRCGTVNFRLLEPKAAGEPREVQSESLVRLLRGEKGKLEIRVSENAEFDDPAPTELSGVSAKK